MKAKTISDQAKEALSLFDKDNPRKVWAFSGEVFGSRDGYYDAFSKVINESHISHDYSYPWVVEFLQALVDAGAESGYEAEDLVNELEADIYTSDLTEWLNSSVNHVFYIDDALREYGEFESGINLLAVAQQIAKRELAWSVLSIFA